MFYNTPFYLVFLFALYFVYRIITQAFPRFFFVPSENWQDKILAVINHPKPIYLKVGVKRSSFRRRLITASVQPSFYTNYVNNKLKLQATDAENSQDSFMNKMKIRDPNDPKRKLIYGFFHPYANNGGGGEKVLWQAVEATLLEDQRNIVAVYTCNIDAEPLQILDKAKQKFMIKGLDSRRIVFIYLRRYSAMIGDSYWKHFTLAGQLLGSVLLSLEAMYELSPDVWVDTMGLPGSYWLVNWILKIPIVAYVHYPIIQRDMFNKLKVKSWHDISSLRFSLGDLQQLFKYVYWSVLYYFYMYLGSCVDLTLANGTWTYNHIKDIWALNVTRSIEILYPPCSTEMLIEEDSITSNQRDNKLLYIAQFRPEKRHSLVLSEYSTFVEKFRAAKLPLTDLPKVVFLGSCRSPNDSSTLDALKVQVNELALAEYVEFVVDCSFEDVRATLRSSKFGVNAMWNEHFGIGVVEYVSSGVVPIVHASAGPLLDILRVDEVPNGWKNEIGFFFKSTEDPDFQGVKDTDVLEFDVAGNKYYYPTLSSVLEKLFIAMPEESSDACLGEKRELGAKLMQERFSNKKFTNGWMDYVRQVSVLEVRYRENRRDDVNAVY